MTETNRNISGNYDMNIFSEMSADGFRRMWKLTLFWLQRAASVLDSCQWTETGNGSQPTQGWRRCMSHPLELAICKTFLTCLSCVSVFPVLFYYVQIKILSSTFKIKEWISWLGRCVCKVAFCTSMNS